MEHPLYFILDHMGLHPLWFLLINNSVISVFFMNWDSSKFYISGVLDYRWSGNQRYHKMTRLPPHTGSKSLTWTTLTESEKSNLLSLLSSSSYDSMIKHVLWFLPSLPSIWSKLESAPWFVQSDKQLYNYTWRKKLQIELPKDQNFAYWLKR
jgi:hypothetical protein